MEGMTMNDPDQPTTFTVDEDVASTLRATALTLENNTNSLVEAGVLTKFTDHGYAVATRMRHLAWGLEQGWLGDTRGEQEVTIDLTDYQGPTT